MERRRLRSLLVSGTGLAAFLAGASAAYARAGGGGHFSGGGGGGNGGGFGGGGGGGHGGGFGGGGGGHFGDGSSGGSADATTVIIFAVFVATVILIVVFNKLQESNRKHTVRRGASALDLGAVERLAKQLKQADPAFDAARFYQRIGRAFLTIQSAWSTQDLRPMQPFVSDGVFERFGLQIREQRSLGYRDRLDQVRVERVLLARVAQGDVFEAASLRIDASAVDYEVSLRDGKPLRGSRSAKPFTEYWTFVRRRGTTTLSGDGLIEGNCPNCGGDISLNQNAACAHCGALLRSGRHDWVLCEITQASEWRAQPASVVPGFDALHAADPGLSTDDLEDRASVMFWRRAEADRTDNPAALRKVALDDFVSARAARRQPAGAGARRHWFGEIGVGAVDTVGLIPGDDFDRAAVRITWSGTRFSQAAARERGGETSVIRELFVLARRHGVRSDPDKGITSAHCPACGTPVSDVLSNACESCGTVLNDGSLGWVLESIDAGASDRATELLHRARSLPLAESGAADTAGRREPLPSARGLLIWAIKTAASDGRIDAKERAMIERLADKAGLPSGDVAALVAAAGANRLDTPEPQDRGQVDEWLTAMVGIALVDGRLASAEAALLKSMAGRAGLSDADVRLLIKREQARLYAASREALRGPS